MHGLTLWNLQNWLIRSGASDLKIHCIQGRFSVSVNIEAKITVEFAPNLEDALESLAELVGVPC